MSWDDCNRLLTGAPDRCPCFSSCLPDLSKTQVWSFSLGFLHASLSPEEPTHYPHPQRPPSSGLCLLPGAHGPVWAQVLKRQGVCQSHGAVSRSTLALGLFLLLCLSHSSYFFFSWFTHLSSIKIQLRHHFPNPRLACLSLDFCTL